MVRKVRAGVILPPRNKSRIKFKKQNWPGDLMFKIGFYVPGEQLEQVKNAMFDAGAGRVGNYEHCAWQSKGQGQFRPVAGSQPYIGEQDQLETLEEYRVEMVLEKKHAAAVVAAMKAAHPYEEPAYDVIELLEL